MVQKREAPVSAGAECNVKSRKKNQRKPANGARARTQRFPGAEELARIQANPEFAKAYKAIARHQKGEWVGQDLSGTFAARACLAVLPVPQSRNFREGIWLQGTGKSWKTLTEFPGRLQRMADDIEILNTKFFGIPEACENPTLASFYQLPTILRSYAETLSRRTTRIPKAFPAAPRSRRLSELSNFAMWFTGKNRDKEIVELLNAAAIAMGYESMPGFDATQLAQARYRRNKRRKT
jgi:hypothetical protein